MSAKLNLKRLAVALAGLAAIPFSATGQDSSSSSKSSYQAKNFFVLDNPSTLVAGVGMLTRTRGAVSFNVHTSGLMAGAHTIWIVIFNKPQSCASGPGRCMATDLSNPAVEGSVIYGAGTIVGADGIANFRGDLREGPPPTGVQVNVPAGTANGLKNSRRAEIHLVVRTHGPVTADGGAVEQLSTFESDCSACRDLQGVVFEAVNSSDDQGSN